MTDIQKLRSDLLSAIDSAIDEKALEAVRVQAVGKKGTLSLKLKELGSMDAEQRREAAPQIHALRDEVTNALQEKRASLKEAALKARLEQEVVDVTLPVPLAPELRGRIHPVSQVIDEMVAIYSDLGFTIADGPTIETDYYNFTALNFPLGHPAREMHDTFFLQPDENGERKLLRTHTSPVQIRTMEKQAPPLRIIIPGKTYRMDSDATHSPMFHQLEGLVIDKSSTIAHMMWLHKEFCKAFFEVDSLNMRFRPSFFPFTEPSIEVDIQCERSGSQLAVGKGTGWLEVLGCGMVHPQVLRNVGYDPDIYQGFAWGMGVDRMAMLKYSMPDLRAFFEADIRWLRHYGFRPLDIPTLFAGLSHL